MGQRTVRHVSSAASLRENLKSCEKMDDAPILKGQAFDPTRLRVGLSIISNDNVSFL